MAQTVEVDDSVELPRDYTNLIEERAATGSQIPVHADRPSVSSEKST